MYQIYNIDNKLFATTNRNLKIIFIHISIIGISVYLVYYYNHDVGTRITILKHSYCLAPTYVCE